MVSYIRKTEWWFLQSALDSPFTILKMEQFSHPINLSRDIKSMSLLQWAGPIRNGAIFRHLHFRPNGSTHAEVEYFEARMRQDVSKRECLIRLGAAD